MIANNTIICIAVGAALIGFALFLRQVWKKNIKSSEGWAGFFGVVGLIMAVMGFATSIMWPYGTGGFEYANIAFGEPAAVFGVLCLFAAVYLWRNRQLFAGDSTAEVKKMRTEVTEALRPVAIFVFITGLMMAALAMSWIRFQNGAAPEVEPISGLFHAMPLVEALFLFGLWGITAIGCLVFPWALSSKRGKLRQVVVSTWIIAGVVFAGFGAMNFYTHIGMYTNINKGTNYRI